MTEAEPWAQDKPGGRISGKQVKGKSPSTNSYSVTKVAIYLFVVVVMVIVRFQKNIIFKNVFQLKESFKSRIMTVWKGADTNLY